MYVIPVGKASARDSLDPDSLDPDIGTGIYLYR